MNEYIILATNKAGIELFTQYGFHYIYDTVKEKVLMMAKEAYVLPVWNETYAKH